MTGITVICFTFPPFEGIGGRRWAKFAKYLKKSNFDIHVIAANKNKGKISNWNKDINLYSDSITYLPTNYPLVLTTIPKTIGQKILYRLATYIVKLLSKGNYYDHSIFFSKKLLPEVEKCINNGAQIIIVSCAPFHMAYDVIQLKKKYPLVSFWVDFRDPWTNNKSSFGFSGLKEQRIKRERIKEKEVISNYDKVISVSDEMSLYFKSLIEYNKEKCVTIPNGFDLEDLITNKPIKRLNKLKLVFTGSLYDKAIHQFISFVNVLKDFESNHPQYFNEIEIEIAGYVPSSFIEYINQCNIISYKGNLTLDETYSLLSEADAALLFLTDDLNYTFSTKFYEYIAMKLPIVVCSNYGKTSEYVTNNFLGYAFSPDNMKQGLIKLIDDWRSNNLIFNNSYDNDKHSIEFIVKDKLLPLIKSN